MSHPSGFQAQALREILRAKEAHQDDRRLRAFSKPPSIIRVKTVLLIFSESRATMSLNESLIRRKSLAFCRARARISSPRRHDSPSRGRGSYAVGICAGECGTHSRFGKRGRETAWHREGGQATRTIRRSGFLPNDVGCLT